MTAKLLFACFLGVCLEELWKMTKKKSQGQEKQTAVSTGVIVNLLLKSNRFAVKAYGGVEIKQ